MKQTVMQVLAWGFLAYVVGVVAVATLVTARRPADDRDAFIRNLPPPSQPLAVRAAHLRLLLRQALTKHAKVCAVTAAVLVVMGVLAAWGIKRPIEEGIAAMAVALGLPGILWAAFYVVYLFARYRGAQLRLLNDSKWHGQSDILRSPVSTDS